MSSPSIAHPLIWTEPGLASLSILLTMCSWYCVTLLEVMVLGGVVSWKMFNVAIGSRDKGRNSLTLDAGLLLILSILTVHAVFATLDYKMRLWWTKYAKFCFLWNSYKLSQILPNQHCHAACIITNCLYLTQLLLYFPLLLTFHWLPWA